MEIEQIERLRRQAGIDDAELRGQVSRLRAGDVVRLTFLAGTAGAETLPVRVTAVRRAGFRGELAAAPRRPQFAGLRLGLAVTFSPGHVHSVSRAAGKAGHRRPQTATQPKAGPHARPNPEPTRF